MAKFPEYFLQQVAQANDIVEVVGQYVALKKRGREFVCLCPFHDDHKPSMYVSPAKQIFKCFVCGAGGGVFQFLTLYDKITFPEAVKALAERASIPLPRETAPEEPPPPGTLSKADLGAVMVAAARFFRDALRSPGGQGALQYALGRGLTEESIRRFGLGFAPDSWDALVSSARRLGLSETQLASAGLIIPREGGRGFYDRFRNRLMFPILEAAGKVIGFGGRALDPNDRAKYLNSAESILFDKSGHLYALNWARESIVSSGQAVVVEGYMDALIPHQAGVGNVVATMGTALTERHVRLLARYAEEVVLVFDADAAGAAAADRALELFLAQRVNVRVATIPAGKDPCDYTLAEGGEAFRQLLAGAPDALHYAWSRRQGDLEAAGDNLAARQRVIEEFLRLIVSSASYGAIDEVRRGQLAQHIGHLLNVSPADLQRQMHRLARQLRRPAGPQQPAADSGLWDADAARTTAMAERQILEVLLNRPDLLDLAAERIDWHDFQDEKLQGIARAVWQMGHAGTLRLEEMLAAEELAPFGALLTDLALTGERRGQYEPTLQGALSAVLYAKERQEILRLKMSGYSDETLRRVSQHLGTGDIKRYPKIT